MNPGDGENSYATNSGLQKLGLIKAKSMIEGALEDICNNNQFFTECFRMADFGCSSGPNSLFVISSVIDTIERLSREKKQTLPEFQVFLNDVPENDFNSLYKLLPTFYEDLQQPRGSMTKRCFISGMPGSFYGRLFPTKSLHFAHSSYSLLWLSQVPEGLMNSKENIYISMTSPPDMFEAYLKQYQRDFSTFLSLRAEEIVGGGRMVLVFICRDVADPAARDDIFHYTMLGKSLLDLVAEGLIKEADFESFNVPVYMPYKDEVKAVIQNEGSFELNEMEVFEVNWDGSGNMNNKDYVFDNYNAAKFAASCVRAFIEPTLVTHFGSSIIDHLFARFTHHMAEQLCVQRTSFNMAISLTRKSISKRK